MKVRCGQIWVASLLLLVGCADNPPVVIENRSVVAVDIPPEVRQANSDHADYGPNLAAGPDYLVEEGDTLYAVAFRLGVDYRALASLNGIEAPYVIRVGQLLKTAPDTASASTPAAPAINGPQTSTPPHAGGTNAERSVESTAGNSTVSASGGERVAAAAKPVATETESGPSSLTLSTPRTPTPNAPVDRWFWPAAGKVSRAYSAERHKGIDLVGERGSPVMATAAGVVVYAGTGVTGYGALLIVKHNDTYLSAYGHNDALLAAEGQQVDAGQIIARMGSTSSDSVKLHFEIRRNGRPVNPMSLLPQR